MGPAAVVHTDGPKKGQLIAGMFFLPPAFVTNSPFPEKHWWEAVSKVWKSGKAYMPGHGLDTPNPKPNYGLVVSTWKKIVAKLVDKDGNFEMPSRNDEESFTDQVKDLEKRASQVLKYSKTHGDEKAAKMAAKLLGQKAAKSKEAKKFLDGPGSTPVNVTNESKVNLSESISRYGTINRGGVSSEDVIDYITKYSRNGKKIKNLSAETAKKIADLCNEIYRYTLGTSDAIVEFDVSKDLNSLIFNVSVEEEFSGSGPRYLPEIWSDIEKAAKRYGKISGTQGGIDYLDDSFPDDTAKFQMELTVHMGHLSESRNESPTLAKLIESNLRLKRQIFRESAGLAIQEKIQGMSESQAERFVKSLKPFSEFRNIEQFKSYLDKK
jgi:hypothetical protein